MILLLKGLAKATAAAISKLRATRHRIASIFIIQQINTIFVSATEIRSGDRLGPHTVLKLGTSFARRGKLIVRLRLTMRLDPKRNILAQQLDHVCSVWLR